MESSRTLPKSSLWGTAGQGFGPERLGLALVYPHTLLSKDKQSLFLSHLIRPLAVSP